MAIITVLVLGMAVARQRRVVSSRVRPSCSYHSRSRVYSSSRRGMWGGVARVSHVICLCFCLLLVLFTSHAERTSLRRMFSAESSVHNNNGGGVLEPKLSNDDLQMTLPNGPITVEAPNAKAMHVQQPDGTIVDLGTYQVHGTTGKIVETLTHSNVTPGDPDEEGTYEGPCAAVSARAAIKVVQVEAFKMKIDASTSCGDDAISQVKKLAGVVRTQLAGTGNWGKEGSAKANEVLDAAVDVTAGFRDAELYSYKALRCVKRCGKCSQFEDKENTPAVTKLVSRTQNGLMRAKSAVLRAQASVKEAGKILRQSGELGPALMDAKKMASVALEHMLLFLDMAATVADGAWFAIHEDGLRAGKAAAKHWLDMVGAPGDYMKEHGGGHKIMNVPWPAGGRAGKCHVAKEKLAGKKTEFEALEDAHHKKMVGELEQIRNIGGAKLLEEKKKKAQFARSRDVVRSEEASKKPDVCEAKAKHIREAIPRSGCMHGCNARVRQFAKYASPAGSNAPPSGVIVRTETLAEKNIRYSARRKRLGVLKWLENHYLHQSRMNNRSLPVLFLDLTPDTKRQFNPVAVHEFRQDLLGELKKATPNLFRMAKEKTVPTSSRDILKAVIHNAGLQYDETNPTIAEEVVNRDRVVLEQMLKEGLVVSADEKEEHPPPDAVVVDPSTILHTDEQCSEYCDKTRSQVLTDIAQGDPDAKSWTASCSRCCATVIPSKVMAKTIADIKKADPSFEKSKKPNTLAEREKHALAKDLGYLNGYGKDHATACEDLRKWSPCVQVCDRTGKSDVGLDRSGCITGCREALLKGIPDSSDCAQYCDETVDQVFLDPKKFAKSIIFENGNATMPRSAPEAKARWVRACVDSCHIGFDLSKSLFEKKHKQDYCKVCPGHC